MFDSYSQVWIVWTDFDFDFVQKKMWFVFFVCRYSDWTSVGVLCLLERSNDKWYMGFELYLTNRCKTVPWMLCKWNTIISSKHICTHTHTNELQFHFFHTCLFRFSHTLFHFGIYSSDCFVVVMEFLPFASFCRSVLMRFDNKLTILLRCTNCSSINRLTDSMLIQLAWKYLQLSIAHFEVHSQYDLLSSLSLICEFNCICAR